MRYQRIITIVIDSLGIGAAPDAELFHDEGSDTLGHIDASFSKLAIPNLVSLGLANLCNLKHTKRIKEPLGYYARMLEASTSKDTISGHWEMMGVAIEKPFLTFSETGFPQKLIPLRIPYCSFVLMRKASVLIVSIAAARLPVS